MGSHDFIQFPPKLERLPRDFWLLLGEVEGMLRDLRSSPLQPDEVEHLREIYLAKGVHATTAIEGNRLLELDVLHQVRDDWPRSALLEKDHREIDNMIEAYAAVNDERRGDEQPLFSLEWLHRYHRLIMRGLTSAEVKAGALREHSVTVGRYLAPPAEDCESLLDEFCAWLNSEAEPPTGQARYKRAWALVKAIAAHAHFAWIHPYADGNGRMARLIEYALLARARLPDCAAHVPAYAYWRSRQGYYAGLQASHGDVIDGAYSQSELSQFIVFALEIIRDQLNELDTRVKTLQMSSMLRVRIREAFAAILTVPQQRRLRLAQDLALEYAGRPMHFMDIWDNVDFMPTGEFEFSLNQFDHDLMALIRMGLVKGTDDGYVTSPDIFRDLVGLSGLKPGDLDGSSAEND